jgi:ABC-2 type transport system ATP-binding protein
VTASAIELRGVGKRYRKLEEQATLLRSLLPFAKPRRSDFWALRDVDLTVAPGETLGVIGRNGAGKTTLLRLLAGVSAPTEGRVVVNGRVAPLIGVGVGFHREMSGRENVLVNGMLLGLTEEEIRERFDVIVAFAELGDFIDVPVKFYSSGMFMRLGFSVAIHTDPQVLLVDEVLAVGDQTFQVKCLDRMRHLQRQGTTIVLVSHSMHAIRLLCPRTIVAHRGRVVFDGETEGAIDRHFELLGGDGEVLGADPHEQRVASGVGVEVVGLYADGRRVHSVDRGVPLVAQVRATFDAQCDSPVVTMQIFTEDGTLAYAIRTPVGLEYRMYAAGDEATIDVDFRQNLVGGVYRLTAQVESRDGRVLLGADRKGVMFYADPSPNGHGIADIEATGLMEGTALTVDPATYKLVAADEEVAR